MHLRPMIRADIPACVTIAADSFIGDGFMALRAPRRHEQPGGWRKFNFENLRKRFLQPGCWGVVCVQDPLRDGVDSRIRGDEVLGFALWQRYTPSNSTSLFVDSPYLHNNTTLSACLERFLCRCEDDYNFHLRINTAINHTLQSHFRGTGSSPLFAPLSDRWELCTLCVAPLHQRKGVGGMLLEWGFQRCREGASPPLPAVLISSASGQKLYNSKGFKVATVLGEELKVGGGAAMVWDEAGAWTEAVEGRRSKGGVPIEIVIKGSENDTALEDRSG